MKEHLGIDLSFATTDEILKELQGRCDTFVFIALMKAEQTPDKTPYRADYAGGIYPSIGLLQQALHDILHRKEKKIEGER